MRAYKLLIVATVLLLVSALPVSAFAQHRGFAGGGMHVARVAPVYRPFFGFGAWGPAYPWGYWDPWYGGPSVVEVQRINYGTVEFKVKPENTKLYVDQKYLGTIQDQEGRHHATKLPEGYHTIKLVAPDGREVERTIYLAIGQKIKIDQNL